MKNEYVLGGGWGVMWGIRNKILAYVFVDAQTSTRLIFRLISSPYELRWATCRGSLEA